MRSCSARRRIYFSDLSGRSAVMFFSFESMCEAGYDTKGDLNGSSTVILEASISANAGDDESVIAIGNPIPGMGGVTCACLSTRSSPPAHSTLGAGI